MPAFGSGPWLALPFSLLGSAGSRGRRGFGRRSVESDAQSKAGHAQIGPADVHNGIKILERLEFHLRVVITLPELLQEQLAKFFSRRPRFPAGGEPLDGDVDLIVFEDCAVNAVQLGVERD